MVKSRAAYFEGPGKVYLKDLDLTPGPNQVLVKTFQASICGTDKIAFRGDISSEVKLPIFPWGHEGGGTVVEVGSKVNGFSVGDKVMSFGKGTYADYVLFDMPYGCLPAPEGVDMDIACLGEPLTCAVFASQLVSKSIQVGDIVAVIGAGFAGQILAQGARKGGAEKVVVIDIVDEKLNLAKRLGANTIVNPKKENHVEDIKAISDGRGVDVVVEASGSGEGLNIASNIVRRNGTIAIYSHYMKPFTVNMYRWHEDALNIVHTCLMHRTKEEMVVGIRDAFRLIKRGIFDVRPLLNRKYKLEEIKEAFENEIVDQTSIKTLILP
ncbi:MAG: zinc-binding dehydrogenase [Nitrososphaeria archaeon]|jgi:L-iditol 2-dehydrogenase